MDTDELLEVTHGQYDELRQIKLMIGFKGANAPAPIKNNIISRVHPDKVMKPIEEEENDPIKLAKGNIKMLIFSILLPRIFGIISYEYSVNSYLNRNNFLRKSTI